jgi:hypothetical protein
MLSSASRWKATTLTGKKIGLALRQIFGTATMKGTDANGNPAYGTVFTIAGLPAK